MFNPLGSLRYRYRYLSTDITVRGAVCTLGTMATMPANAASPASKASLLTVGKLSKIYKVSVCARDNRAPY